MNISLVKVPTIFLLPKGRGGAYIFYLRTVSCLAKINLMIQLKPLFIYMRLVNFEKLSHVNA